jgi:phage baseplate assembly protein W
MAIRYKGFNTINQSKKFRLTDLELVKRDLLNHFSIRKGEKLMQPEFGSIIWNMLYEPLTPEVQAIIVADVKRIIEYDPRLSIDGVLINELAQGIQLQIDLTFLPNNYSDRLVVNFDNNSKNLTLVS